MLKKIAIIFPDANLPYSPTTIGIFKFLKKKFNTELICIKPRDKNSPLLNEEGIRYINRLSGLEIVYHSVIYFIKSALGLIPSLGRYRYKRQQNLNKYLKQRWQQFDILIAIDTDSYWNARTHHRNCIFLSLEIMEKDPLVSYLRENLPKACIIQSDIRYRFYFPNGNVPYLHLPNAPVMQEYEKLLPEHKRGLIYSGAAIDYFGFKYCLDFINTYPEYTLTLKGSIDTINRERINSVYKHLQQDGRLVMSTDYLQDDEIVPFTNKFRIGFCFYDYTIPFVNTFNYQTAPSGKLFTYLAAGVPVVCSHQIGLQFVEEEACGVCITNFEPQCIKEAIDKIESNYEEYVANCYRVFAQNNFHEKADLIIDALCQL